MFKYFCRSASLLENECFSKCYESAQHMLVRPLEGANARIFQSRWDDPCDSPAQRRNEPLPKSAIGENLRGEHIDGCSCPFRYYRLLGTQRREDDEDNYDDYDYERECIPVTLYSPVRGPPLAGGRTNGTSAGGPGPSSNTTTLHYIAHGYGAQRTRTIRVADIRPVATHARCREYVNIGAAM